MSYYRFRIKTEHKDGEVKVWYEDHFVDGRSGVELGARRKLIQARNSRPEIIKIDITYLEITADEFAYRGFIGQ